ncbi:MAG: tRNA (adenosine(37)-N6)-threonylcarbamoyltransferase complex dimerization subunit type 1 TsaB [Acidimicrobiales bacterium]|nr:tRNA (adenosine(37)-N6)-threonylcarbamoyltransferase complex dimerization subunit type 1 TsaB [Acidimicrobiales bacterium]
MLILGIESATTRVGCAIGGHEGVLASAHSSRGRRHAEALAPQIKFIAEQAGISLREIGAVAVDVGPGLYTGLRVGVTTALSVATTLRVPMIGVTSLDLLAFPAALTDRKIVAAIDARRAEVFHASYRRVPGGVQRISEPAITRPGDLVAAIEADGEPALVVGDAAVAHADLFGSAHGVEVADESFAHPSAGSLVALAHARALREEFVRPDEIEPLYLRRPDAEAKWDTEAGA